MSQIGISATILTALLTCGILMIFIENRHMAENITQFYLGVMKPFMHRLSNYFKYLSCVGPTYFEKDANKRETLDKYWEVINILRGYTHKTIMNGQDFQVGYFTAHQIKDICETIHSVWYIWYNHRELLSQCHINIDSETQDLSKRYLHEVFDESKYYSLPLLEQCASVSSEFYSEIYQPIWQIPFQYEEWLDMDKRLKYTVLTNIILSSIGLVFVLLFSNNIVCGCFIILITIFCLFLLVVALLQLIRIDSYSKRIFR